MTKSVTQNLGKAIQIDEDQIQQHLGELVRGTFEETLTFVEHLLQDQIVFSECDGIGHADLDADRHITAVNAV